MFLKNADYTVFMIQTATLHQNFQINQPSFRMWPFTVFCSCHKLTKWNCRICRWRKGITLPPCFLWKANCDYVSSPLKAMTKSKDIIQSKHKRTYRGDLGFFGFSSPGWWNSSIVSTMFMSGIAVESINETFISIAFFLPFFPLTVPLPLPFPVVLVTYKHTIQLV